MQSCKRRALTLRLVWSRVDGVWRVLQEVGEVVRLLLSFRAYGGDWTCASSFGGGPTLALVLQSWMVTVVSKIFWPQGRASSGSTLASRSCANKAQQLTQVEMAAPNCS